MCEQVQHLLENGIVKQARHAVHVKYINVLDCRNCCDCYQAHFPHGLCGRVKVSPYACDVRHATRERMCYDALHALFPFLFNHENGFALFANFFPHLHLNTW
jgi:hypothetical protein